MLTGISVIVRGLLRRLSLTDRLDSLGRILCLPSKDDFDREVHEFLTAEIKPADVVWEVGANRGGLTRLLSSLVGRDGLVIAIEPEWTNMARLASVVGASPNVSLVDAALSNSDGDAPLYVSDTDASGRAHSLAASRTSSHRTTNVPTVRGDSLVQRGLAAAPTFLVIDVEGTEDLVLGGLATTLRSPRTRGALIEIHFSILEKEGRAFAPARIESSLTSCGFSVRWLTRSHLAAIRKSASPPQTDFPAPDSP